MNIIRATLDDVLVLCGCACILYGLSLWSAVVTWIVGGLLLIALGVLYGNYRNGK